MSDDKRRGLGRAETVWIIATMSPLKQLHLVGLCVRLLRARMRVQWAAWRVGLTFAEAQQKAKVCRLAGRWPD